MMQSLTRNNKPNVMNVHAVRADARAVEGTATDVDGRVTGQISVTHAFRATEPMNDK